MQGLNQESISKALEVSVDRFSWPPDLSDFKQLASSFEKPKGLPFFEDMGIEPCKVSINDAQVNLLINEGAKVCKQLKAIFPDKDWMELAGVLTKLKNVSRKYYPGLNDLELLKVFESYKSIDFLEALS